MANMMVQRETRGEERGKRVLPVGKKNITSGRRAGGRGGTGAMVWGMEEELPPGPRAQL